MHVLHAPVLDCLWVFEVLENKRWSMKHITTTVARLDAIVLLVLSHEIRVWGFLSPILPTHWATRVGKHDGSRCMSCLQEHTPDKHGTGSPGAVSQASSFFANDPQTRPAVIISFGFTKEEGQAAETTLRSATGVEPSTASRLQPEEGSISDGMRVMDVSDFDLRSATLRDVSEMYPLGRSLCPVRYQVSTSSTLFLMSVYRTVTLAVIEGTEREIVVEFMRRCLFLLVSILGTAHYTYRVETAIFRK